MNTVGIKKEIIDLINVLKKRFDNLENQEHIPKTELENILNSVENFYKKVVVFNYLNEINSTANENQSNASLIKNDSGAMSAQNNILMESEKIVEKETTDMEIQQEEKEQHLPVSEVTVIADLAEVAATPVVEKSNTTEVIEDKAGETQKAPLTDLKSGIGINDKFQYISELFEGSGEKYEDAIQKLNAYESLEPSLLYLEDIQKLYCWKEDSVIVKRLSDLVRNRFK